MSPAQKASIKTDVSVNTLSKQQNHEARKKRAGIKIVVGYPPIKSKKGTPLLSQNRQFQYFNSPTYIYPMVPAYAASNLKDKGYTVFWMDGISERQTYAEWLDKFADTEAEYLLLESKSPVIKKHWEQVDLLKKRFPDLKVILCGDHVTAFPLETFENCSVDYVIKGGDYDFVVVNLLNHIYNDEPLEPGVLWRKGNKDIKALPTEMHEITVKNTKRLKNLENKQNFEKAEKSQDLLAEFNLENPADQKTKRTTTIFATEGISLRHNINDLPFVDRDLTKWELYAYENGNYKYLPATYMYSGRDCWYNRCTFCVWDHTINPIGSYRSFSPERLFAEVKHVVDEYGVREIFDDAGTMFVGPKLKRFCELLIESGYNKKVRYGCNMRFNALNQKYYDLMAEAGFRFILYGMESGNQKTLDKLDKGTNEADTINGARMASKAGLEPHATIMLGYPWETYEDAKRTIEIAKYCFKKGYFNTMQATIIMPYPGTPLWKECLEKDWLLTSDYNDFDMRGPVMKIPFEEEKLMELTQDLYSAFFSPQYIMRKVVTIRNLDDIKFFYMAGKKLFGHLLDFDPNQTAVNWKSLEFWKNASNRLFSHFFRKDTNVDAEKDIVKLEDSAVNLSN